VRDGEVVGECSDTYVVVLLVHVLVEHVRALEGGVLVAFAAVDPLCLWAGCHGSSVGTAVAVLERSCYIVSICREVRWTGVLRSTSAARVAIKKLPGRGLVAGVWLLLHVQWWDIARKGNRGYKQSSPAVHIC